METKFLIIGLIVALILIIFSSMSLWEVSASDDTETNVSLFGFSILAGVICAIVLGSIPLGMDTGHKHGLNMKMHHAYIAMAFGLFGLIQACFSGLAAIDTPQTKSVNITLGVMAGITLLSSLAGAGWATYELAQGPSTNAKEEKDT